MKISKYRLGSNKGLKIVLLSDLHNRPYEHIIKTTAAINPDIIAIAGDLTYGFKQYDLVPGFLSACGNIAHTFVAIGNHDVAEIIEPMCSSAQGVALLDNGYVDTVVKGIPLRIGGLSSPTSRHWQEIVDGVEIKRDKSEPKSQKLEPNTAWLKDFTNTSSYKLLLYHNPNTTHATFRISLSTLSLPDIRTTVNGELAVRASMHQDRDGFLNIAEVCMTAGLLFQRAYRTLLGIRGSSIPGRSLW